VAGFCLIELKLVGVDSELLLLDPAHFRNTAKIAGSKRTPVVLESKGRQCSVSRNAVVSLRVSSGEEGQMFKCIMSRRFTGGCGLRQLLTQNFARSTPLAPGAMLLLLLLGFTPGALAQNLVPNPNFDAVLAPWTQFLSAAPDPAGAGAAPARVASPDFNSSPGSGSALVDINTTTPATNAASGISQCFNFSATPVNFVNYGGSFLVPATTTADGAINATVEIRLFAAANCTNFISGGSQGRTFLSGLATNTWYTASDNNFALPGAPVTAASAEIRGYLRQTGGAAPTQTDYKTSFDKFFLVLNSTTPVRLLQFDVE